VRAEFHYSTGQQLVLTFSENFDVLLKYLLYYRIYYQYFPLLQKLIVINDLYIYIYINIYNIFLKKKN